MVEYIKHHTLPHDFDKFPKPMQKFLKRINNITDWQLLDMLIKSIKYPVIKLDFHHVLVYNEITNNFYGCIHTNFLLKLFDKKDRETILEHHKQSKLSVPHILDVKYGYYFSCFDNIINITWLINYLRWARLDSYNLFAGQSNFPFFSLIHSLEPLNEHNYKQNLKSFEDLRDKLKKEYEDNSRKIRKISQ